MKIGGKIIKKIIVCAALVQFIDYCFETKTFIISLPEKKNKKGSR